MDQSQYRRAPAADFVLPFDLPNLGMRGRILRLDAVSTRALAAHPLPEGGQRILAEAMGLSALLGSALKFEGRLSVQTKGDGPLNLLVTDYFAGGGLRGYARLDERLFAEAGRPSDFGTLVGEGALAITIEPKRGAQPYQGLVPLSPNGLAASAEIYFAQSEQLPTVLRLAAGPIYRSGAGHGWRAGALMVQAVPGAKSDEGSASDDWRRVALFMQTLEAIELLDTELAAETVLETINGSSDGVLAYNRKLAKELLPEISLSSKLAKAFYQTLPLSFHLLKRRPISGIFLEASVEGASYLNTITNAPTYLIRAMQAVSTH